MSWPGKWTSSAPFFPERAAQTGLPKPCDRVQDDTAGADAQCASGAAGSAASCRVVRASRTTRSQSPRPSNGLFCNADSSALALSASASSSAAASQPFTPVAAIRAA